MNDTSLVESTHDGLAPSVADDVSIDVEVDEEDASDGVSDTDRSVELTGSVDRLRSRPRIDYVRCRSDHFLNVLVLWCYTGTHASRLLVIQRDLLNNTFFLL